MQISGKAGPEIKTKGTNKTNKYIECFKIKSTINFLNNLNTN